MQMSYSKTFANSSMQTNGAITNYQNRFWLWLSIVWETLKLTWYQSKQFSFITFLEQRQILMRLTWLCEQIIFIHSAKLFSTLKKLTFSISSGHTTTGKSPGSYSLPYSLPSLWKSARESRQTHHFDQATWQHPRESRRHVRGSARIDVVRMAQFVLKIEKLSHIIGARGF